MAHPPWALSPCPLPPALQNGGVRFTPENLPAWSLRPDRLPRLQQQQGSSSNSSSALYMLAVMDFFCANRPAQAPPHGFLELDNETGMCVGGGGRATPGSWCWGSWSKSTTWVGGQAGPGVWGLGARQRGR